MRYEFLKQFPRRMKHVGMYSLLLANSSQKQIWKNYGFLKLDEQVNLIFSLLLYIMEQSLKEENCTLDDIGAFIDSINTAYFYKNMSYDDCKILGDFIINVVLADEGKAMYFDGYDFERRAYKIMNISYIANKVVYVDSEARRTSYYLTDDGYNLLLSTLEIENNMKLTIHEMIFKMHLERQSYDKAVDEIKNVFNLLRIQLQKIQEAMLRVRRNALNYSVADYKELLEGDMETIDVTSQKFKNYREIVKKRAQELEEQNINVHKLSADDEEKLNNLKIIESYLSRGIDEHQKILGSHFDLKILYDKELELLAQMSLIQRFSLRTELYDKLWEDSSGLERLDIFFRPLFHKVPDKVYNLSKALELQRPVRKKTEEDDDEILDFDEAEWQEENAEKQRIKLKKYEKSLNFILNIAVKNEKTSLDEIQRIVSDNEELKDILIPDVDIFKEIMVELIRSNKIDIQLLRKEKSEYIVDDTLEFRLNDMILKILDQNDNLKKINRIYINRSEEQVGVEFKNVRGENGKYKTIRCSNVIVSVDS